MADNISIKKKPQPVFESSVQADSPLMSAHETRMATDTTTLWHRTADYRSWFFVAPSLAPSLPGTSSFGDRGGWGIGTINTFILPWCYHVKAVRVWARMIVAHDAAYPFSVYLKSQKLLAADATSTVSGHRSERSDNMPQQGPLAGEWAAAAMLRGYNAFTSLTCSVVPGISGTQRIAIIPSVYGEGSALGGAAGYCDPYLVHLEMWNELQRPR